MAILNFSSFLHVIRGGATSKQMTKLVKGFLDVPIKAADIRNESRCHYKLSSADCSHFFKGEEDIPPKLRIGLNTYLSAYDKGTDSLPILYHRIVPRSFEAITNKNLCNLCNDADNLSAAQKKIISDHYSKGEFDSFIRAVFKYAIQENNKTCVTRPTRKMLTLDDENLSTKDIIDILSSRKRPITIITEDEVDESELTYVKELLKVYSETAHIKFKTKSELSKDPVLLKQFEEQRHYFYAAESIRRGLRDTEVHDRHFFDDYKDDLYEGIKETSGKAYSSGQEKLDAVLERVTIIPLNTLLSKIPGWINNSERKGTCHILANEGKIKWVNDDAE